MISSLDKLLASIVLTLDYARSVGRYGHARVEPKPVERMRGFNVFRADQAVMCKAWGIRCDIPKLCRGWSAGYKVISSDVDGRVEGEDYLRGFEESVFCLAATGDGWGVRLKLAVMFRCIPVIIADQIQVRSFNFTSFCIDQQILLQDAML